MEGKPPHVPVMLAEVLEVLAPRAGAVYVDATFGGGGYTRALLEAAACRVLAVDRDLQACERARSLVARFGDRLRVLHGRFGDMDGLAGSAGVASVDGVAFDLGVSSQQLDDPERGFSFRADGPLDMRMDPGVGPTAAEVVNRLPERDLAALIAAYGEERAARRIAAAIVRARREAPIEGTRRLREVIHGVLAPQPAAIDPATRTFQALRIHVNDELGELDRGLEAAERLLAPGGRLVVVAFHSLEDRRAKSFLRQRCGLAPLPSRHRPEGAAAAPAPSFRLLTRRALKPSAAELAVNVRARSARLRAAERTGARPWPPSHDERRAA
jgi:16S rRNA (cytosine1402-N4)-methyltransferase